MLLDRGIELEATHLVNDHRDLRRRVRRARKKGARLVIVGGGDGTMTAAAGELAKSKVVLGVLPLGTGNSFALSLGITDLELPSMRSWLDGKWPYDLGSVNGTYFRKLCHDRSVIVDR